MTIPIPDMKDDEAVAEWYRQERYGPFRITWDETPNATKESYRQDARLIRRLCREVARKVAEAAYISGFEDGYSDEGPTLEIGMPEAVNDALCVNLGPGEPNSGDCGGTGCGGPNCGPCKES